VAKSDLSRTGTQVDVWQNLFSEKIEKGLGLISFSMVSQFSMEERKIERKKETNERTPVIIQ
jgi:hypothetical protein